VAQAATTGTTVPATQVINQAASIMTSVTTTPVIINQEASIMTSVTEKVTLSPNE
jgi:hypothetical protein